MRAHLFVSALFAASLFGGAAMADRPSDDGAGRTSRVPVREMHVREVREVREVHPHDMPSRQVREPVVLERLRAHGDVVDRSGSRAAARGKASAGDAASIKAQRDAEKALNRLQAKKDAVINCAANVDTCGTSARAAATAAQAAQKAAQKAEANRQRQEVQKMIEKIRAEKIREQLTKKICEKHANMCAENL